MSGPMPRQRALLKFAVSAAVMAVLSGLLLDRLHDLQEESERTVMEATVSNMTSGLRLAVAARIIRGEEATLPALAGSNPMDFLETPPANYVGRCPAPTTGTWCFDAQSGEIVYRPRRDSRLRYPDNGRHELRWRIASAGPAGQPGSPVGAITLVSSASFTWH